MDFVKIKNMVRENGDKIIFMEQGEPELVVMSFAEYEKLARLHLPEPKNPSRRNVSPQMNEPTARDSEGDGMRETEFLTPLDAAPIRAASITGYDRPIALEQEELRRSNIRLEDLPI